MPRHITAVALLLGTTSIAFGQETGESLTLDPIILRTGTEKVASSVPQSVSVIEAEELDEIAAGNIGDILAQVPGVAGVGSSSFFGQGFNIRGFGSDETAASEAGIIQLIDGEKKYFQSYRQGSFFAEPEFIGRVEVLRGPSAATLYGVGALGGVIAVETVDPEDVIPEGQNSGGRVKLGYSSNPDSIVGSVIWGWRPAPDFEALAGFAYRTIGETEDADGNQLVRSNSDMPNMLLKARKSFGDQYIEASYLHLEAEGEDQDFNQLEGAQVGLYPGFPGWGVGDILTRDQTARLEWGWNPEENRLIDATVTLSYTNTIKDVRQGDKPDEPIMDSLLGRRDYALTKLKAQNVMDLSGVGYSHYLTIGAETYRQDRSSSGYSASHPEGYTRSQSVFAWSELEWNRLTINTGLRYERQKTEPKGSAMLEDELGDGKLRAEALEPQIGLLYRLTDNWSVFGSAALVNRVPTVDELYDSHMGGAPSPDLKEEKGKNVEIGVSYRAADLFAAGDEAAMKLTLFRNHIDNMIVRTGLPAPTPAYENIDRAYLRGGELEGSYRSGAWKLGAAISVVEGKNQDDEDLNTLPNNRLVLSASWQASPSWKFGMRSTLAAARDKPVSSTNPTGEDRAGFGTHDIYAIWTPDQGALQGVEVNFGIDNVTNKDYTPATYLLGPAAGRNVKISLSKTF